jgi:hypothetical protein
VALNPKQRDAWEYHVPQPMDYFRERESSDMSTTTTPQQIYRVLTETVWSFIGGHQFPQHIEDRLCVCLGPETYNLLLLHTYPPSPLFRNLKDMMAAADEGAPEGSVGRFMGLWCFRVLDYGPDAAFVCLDPPAPWNPAVTFKTLREEREGEWEESRLDRTENRAALYTREDGTEK